MAERIEHPEERPPPAGEIVHLPGPSYLPAVTAAGIAIALSGIVIAWLVVAVGVLITAVAVFRWIREVREDIAELPLEH